MNDRRTHREECNAPGDACRPLLAVWAKLIETGISVAFGAVPKIWKKI